MMKVSIKEYSCLNCKSNFTSKKACKSRIPKYCSKKCYAESLMMHKKCKLCDKEIINKNSSSLKNRIYCSKDCQHKARLGTKINDSWKQNISIAKLNSDKSRSVNHYNWKGGNETIAIRIKNYAHKRRSLQKKKLPINFLNKLLDNQKNKCFYCNTELTNYKCIEHLTPISKGGDNDIYNLVYSCKSCNSKKRQKTLEQYAIKNKQLHLLNKWEYLFINSL